MNRRSIVRIFSCGICSLFAGCGKQDDDWELSPKLSIYATISSTNSVWDLTIRVRNNYRHEGAELHNVELFGFSDSGDEVCRTPIGDFQESDPSERQVTVTCAEFPAIITATAEESPCDGANIMILYWIGDADQVELSGENVVTLWESTYRECDEPIPPQRVIENIGEIPKNE